MPCDVMFTRFIVLAPSTSCCQEPDRQIGYTRATAGAFSGLGTDLLRALHELLTAHRFARPATTPRLWTLTTTTTATTRVV